MAFSQADGFFAIDALAPRRSMPTAELKSR